MTFRRIRTFGKEIRNYPPIQPVQIPMQKFAEARVNQGMISVIDPADIPTGALVDALNAVSRYDKLQRRNGTVKFSLSSSGPVPNADTNRVLMVENIALSNGQNYTTRFTPSGPAVVNSANQWVLAINNTVPVTPGFPPPSPGGLSGAQIDRFSLTTAWNGSQQLIVFANNGANPLQVLNPVFTTFFPTGLPPVNVPTFYQLSVNNNISTNYRFVTGFSNRVVGAALAGTNEIQVGWSGDTNPTVWDQNVDETAGFSPIQDTPADFSDNISGIFAFTNTMILLRQRSIWLVNPQPIPTDPFNFYSVIPGIGCNCPYSAQVIDDGIAFLDQRKHTVYYFVPGGGIQPIGRPIETIILNGVDSYQDVFSSYDPANNDYTICVPQASSTAVNTYTYNFRTQGWTRSEYDFTATVAAPSSESYISSLNDTNVLPLGLTIGELSGVIANLQGTISQLTNVTLQTSYRVFGRSDGGIMVENSMANNDNMTSITSGDGDAFTTSFVSKDFMLPITDAYFAQIKLEYTESVGGSGTLYYNKQTGAMPLTDSSWTVAKSVTTNTTLNAPQLITFTQQLKARRLSWRLDINAGQFAIVGYEVHNYPSGLQRPSGSGTTAPS
jgi:hypothetical protein